MRVFIRPKKGIIVRHPQKMSYIIPPEGEEVEMSSIWQRYIDAGDVELVQESKKSKGDK